MAFKLLVINPGSTSTSVAVFLDKEQQWSETIPHDQEGIERFEEIYGQLGYRINLVKKCYEAHDEKTEGFDAIVGRGGLLPPIESGAYEVNELMIECLRYRPQSHHVSNLGAPMALEIAKEAGVKAYIYDAIAVDEMEAIYRITGLREIKRKGIGNILNMRAAVLKTCRDKKEFYREKNAIAVNLGKVISAALFSNGKIIDTISDDEGSFSPERVGGLPTNRVVDLCSYRYRTKADILEVFQKKGGLINHLGTSDLKEIENRIEAGDKYASLVYDAMVLNIAKIISNLAVDVNGKVDYIVLTGGMANSNKLVEALTERVSFIAPVEVVPGKNEMEALASGIYRVLAGDEDAKVFTEV